MEQTVEEKKKEFVQQFQLQDQKVMIKQKRKQQEIEVRVNQESIKRVVLDALIHLYPIFSSKKERNTLIECTIEKSTRDSRSN